MADKTHTVVTSWTTAAGAHWVIVKDHTGALSTPGAIPTGSAVRIVGTGSAVRA